MRFGQATESDESSAEVGTPNFGRSCSREEDALFPDAKVGGTPKAEGAAAEEDAAEPKEDAAEEDAAEPKEGAAAAKAENVAEPKEEDAAAQSVAALLGRDERLAPPIPTSWRRPRSGGKGGGSKMGEASVELQLEDSDEAAENILKVPGSAD